MRLTKGSPQGGVKSVMFWIFVKNPLVKALNKGPVKSIAFADDSDILVKGFHLGTMARLAQRALDEAEKWSKRFGLEFCPNKSEVIVFSKGRNTPNTNTTAPNATNPTA